MNVSAAEKYNDTAFWGDYFLTILEKKKRNKTKKKTSQIYILYFKGYIKLSIVLIRFDITLTAVGLFAFCDGLRLLMGP